MLERARALATRLEQETAEPPVRVARLIHCCTAAHPRPANRPWPPLIWLVNRPPTVNSRAGSNIAKPCSVPTSSCIFAEDFMEPNIHRNPLPPVSRGRHCIVSGRVWAATWFGRDVAAGRRQGWPVILAFGSEGSATLCTQGQARDPAVHAGRPKPVAITSRSARHAGQRPKIVDRKTRNTKNGLMPSPFASSNTARPVNG